MNEEREMVLRMLKEGKISVEEADALLQALTEETAAQPAAAEQPQPGQAPTDFGGPEIPDLGTELRKIFHELRQSIPGEVLRELQRAKPWTSSFKYVIRGLSGLEEGHADVSGSERMEPGDVLEVRNAWGDVRLSGSAGPELRMRARIRVWAPTREEAQRLAETLRVGPHREGSRVVVGAPMVMEARRRIDLELDVPAGVDVALDVAKGDIRAEGLRGGASIQVARGDVQVAGQHGRLDLSVASGDIAFRDVEGDVQLDVKSGDVSGTNARGKVNGRILNGDVSVKAAGALSLDILNGDVSLTDIDGDIDVEAKNGDLGISGAQGRTIRARTLSGDIQVLVRRIPEDGAVTAETMSGDIEATLPPDARATIDAATVSGAIACTLPLQGPAAGQAPARGRTLRGILNAPGATVTLRTTRGDIGIRSAG
jgi:hypothetical protein